MPDIERKLTTILAADVVGFSMLMGQDEAATLAALKSSRAIIDSSIEAHHGRIFSTVGDSVIADFSSPVQAVICANEIQGLLADRNQQAEENARMTFRIGINIGDVIIDGENLYGDGVNIAARLEAIGEPGSVCVSSKVFEEVRRKLDLRFVDGGERQLKNIEDPINIFHLQTGADAPTVERAATSTGRGGKPKIAMREIKVIGGGDDELAELADGLRIDITDGLTRQTGLSVAGHGDADVDFALEGSARSAGRRLRLSFTLTDLSRNAQVWSERFDRTMDDLFDLEDEISQSVISVIRIRIKALEFEALENSDNETLAVPDLLSKAAGYFVRSIHDTDRAVAALNTAIERQPDNSMAQAMLAMGLFLHHERSPLALSDAEQAEIDQLITTALSLDGNSYFAHLVTAMVRLELHLDFAAAAAHAEMALEVNPNFTQGQAMLAITQCHLGELEIGLDALQQAIAANREDPHRFRHQRELAVALIIAGREAEAVQVLERLRQQAPELARNDLVAIATKQLAGQDDAASRLAVDLGERFPALTLANMRVTAFADAAQAARFYQALADAGIPE